MIVESNILCSTHLYISSYFHCYFHFICNNIFQLSSLLSSHVYVISSNFHNCLHLMCTCYLPTVITVFISCVRDISPLSLLPSTHVFASYHSPYHGLLWGITFCVCAHHQTVQSEGCFRSCLNMSLHHHLYPASLYSSAYVYILISSHAYLMQLSREFHLFCFP